jgi:hypothetical protein
MKRMTKLYFVVLMAILALLGFIISCQLDQMNVKPDSLQFLNGRTPLVIVQDKRLSLWSYSFAAAYEEIFSQASTELTALGFADGDGISLKPSPGNFYMQDRDYLTVVSIYNGQLSKESTDTYHVYEPMSGWVSVRVCRYGTSRFRRLLGRILPLGSDPKITNRINN